MKNNRRSVLTISTDMISKNWDINFPERRFSNVFFLDKKNPFSLIFKKKKKSVNVEKPKFAALGNGILHSY